VIAQFNATQLGIGSSTLISAAVWLLGIVAVMQVVAFLHDVGDPTYRQQKRERRRARARELRARKQLERRIYAGRFFRRLKPWLIAGMVALLVAGVATTLS
jgi:hypothetical protein